MYELIQTILTFTRMSIVKGAFVIIKGAYGSAKVFAKEVEDGAKEQIENLLNQDFIEGSTVRIMPDVHQGMGCVIGFSADMGDKVIPNIVGVDIGCGMLTVELGKMNINLSQLDTIIHNNIPSGRNTHLKKIIKFPPLQDIKMYHELHDIRRLENSIGTLGGGNHFIEVGLDSKNNTFLVIHSGSRNLGTQVARYYQNLAIDLCSGKEEYISKRDEIITTLTRRGKTKEIKSALHLLEKEYKGVTPKYPKDLCYLTGKYRDQYLHDMNICQQYATVNREVMADIILSHLLKRNLEEFHHFHTIHNYINFKDNIIRKGAISAYLGEKVLIPINMRDGSILAIGKGNKEWNYSAPHGAGRVLSRTEAKKQLNLATFKRSMKGVYSTSIHKGTLDESPLVYKPISEILDSIGDTVEVVDIIKPIYNYKA